MRWWNIIHTQIYVYCILFDLLEKFQVLLCHTSLKGWRANRRTGALKFFTRFASDVGGYQRLSWATILREPQHIPGAYPRHPQTQNERNYFTNCWLGIQAVFQGSVRKFLDSCYDFLLNRRCNDSKIVDRWWNMPSFLEWISKPRCLEPQQKYSIFLPWSWISLLKIFSEETCSKIRSFKTFNKN